MKGSPCELDRIASDIGLSDEVRKEATSICCDLVRKKSTEGNEISVVAASSIYTACRESRVPITLKELASSIKANAREVGRFYISILGRTGISPPGPNGSRYVARVASLIHASEGVAKLSLEIESEAVAAGLSGRSPVSLAAAAVYTASLIKGEPVTQSDVAEAAGVSVISLRESARRMRSLMKPR